ncbi:MAG: S-adenosylmethionine:tRNA ribosyltransferase-isomerase, partial [Coleofasciculus sp. C2-GNP5-27]
PGRRLKVGSTIVFEPDQPMVPASHGETLLSSDPPRQGNTTHKSLLKATIIARDDATKGRILQFDLPKGESLITQLPDYGQVPFPPYITDSQATPDQYQTVYAQIPGAVAAPTAGLHFTPELLHKCHISGIDQA